MPIRDLQCKPVFNVGFYKMLHLLCNGERTEADANENGERDCLLPEPGARQDSWRIRAAHILLLERMSTYSVCGQKNS